MHVYCTGWCLRPIQTARCTPQIFTHSLCRPSSCNQHQCMSMAVLHVRNPQIHLTTSFWGLSPDTPLHAKAHSPLCSLCSVHGVTDVWGAGAIPAARCRGVLSAWSRASSWQPACMRMSITPACPARAAQCSGPVPSCTHPALLSCTC